MAPKELYTCREIYSASSRYNLWSWDAMSGGRCPLLLNAHHSFWLFSSSPRANARPSVKLFHSNLVRLRFVKEWVSVNGLIIFGTLNPRYSDSIGLFVAVLGWRGSGAATVASVPSCSPTAEPAIGSPSRMHGLSCDRSIWGARQRGTCGANQGSGELPTSHVPLTRCITTTAGPRGLTLSGTRG